MWWWSYNSHAFTIQRRTRCWRVFLLWCLDFRSWTNSICTTWDNEFRLIDQNWSDLKNISKRKKRRRRKYSFVFCRFCKSRESFFVSWRTLISRDYWLKLTCWRSCTRWTSIFFECCAESMHCSKLRKWSERTWRSLSTAFRKSWRCTTCEIFQRSRRRRRDYCCHYYYHRFYRFFFFVCCLDRFDLIDFFDFDDFVSNENACLDIRSSRDNNVRNECTSLFEWWSRLWSQT